MYVTTSQNVVLAFDLRTRAELWRYEHKLGTVRFCCGPNNRGAALGHGLVYMATLDAHVVALDAATGAVRWDITAADGASGYSFTMAPLVIDDLVIVGSSGGEFGTRGWVAAYAALSGALDLALVYGPFARGRRLVGQMGGRDTDRGGPAP